MSISVTAWSDDPNWTPNSSVDGADVDSSASEYSAPNTPDSNDSRPVTKRHRSSPISPQSSVSPPMSPPPSIPTKKKSNGNNKATNGNKKNTSDILGGDAVPIRRRRRPPPPPTMSIEEARELKLRRHNESELKRRQKLGGFFAELSDLCNGGNGPKAQMKILQSAIAHVRELQAEKKRLEAKNKDTATSGTSVTGKRNRAQSEEILSPVSVSSTSTVMTPLTPVPLGLTASTAALLKTLPVGATVTHTITQIDGSSINTSMATTTTSTNPSVDTSSNGDVDEGKSSTALTTTTGTALTPSSANESGKDYRDVELALLRSIARTAREVLSSPVDHHYLFRHSCTPCAVISPSLHVLDCNSVMSGLWGMERDEFLGQGLQCTAVTHPNSHQATRDAVKKLLAGSAIETIDKLFILPGHYLSGVLHMWLVRDAQGQPLAIECLLQPRVKYSQLPEEIASSTPVVEDPTAPVDATPTTSIPPAAAAAPPTISSVASSVAAINTPTAATAMMTQSFASDDVLNL